MDVCTYNELLMVPVRMWIVWQIVKLVSQFVRVITVMSSKYCIMYSKYCVMYVSTRLFI